MLNGMPKPSGAGGDDLAGLLARALAAEEAPARDAAAGRIGDLDSDELAAFLALAGWHGVASALWGGLGTATTLLPPDCAAYLEAARHLNARRNDRLLAQAAEIAAATADAGIPAVFLKGTALLARGLHADPATRLVGDIDLLVPVRRVGDAAAALASAGYRRLPDRVEHAHDPVRLLRSDRPGVIELHQAPVAFTLAPALPAEALLARAVEARPGLRVPCAEDLVVHAVIHALLQDHGFRLAQLRLADALDLVRLAERDADTLDWDTVAARLDRLPDGRDALAFALHAAGDSLAAPLPRPVPSARAARQIDAWCRRAGAPAGAWARGAAFLGVYARDLLWRLRNVPGQRRRLLARVAAPAAVLRNLAAIAADGPPATPGIGSREPRP